MQPQLTNLLKTYFGYDSFRPLQQSIITDVLNKQDVFVLMPTGGGKSLCFQLPSLVQNGVTIVISPLISLMKDQVDSLTQNGVKAAFINSSISSAEQQKIMDHCFRKIAGLLHFFFVIILDCIYQRTANAYQICCTSSSVVIRQKWTR